VSVDHGGRFFSGYGNPQQLPQLIADLSSLNRLFQTNQVTFLELQGGIIDILRDTRHTQVSIALTTEPE